MIQVQYVQVLRVQIRLVLTAMIQVRVTQVQNQAQQQVNQEGYLRP